MLSSGYALASSSLNVFGNNCNDLTASETMAMVKERFIEAYGPPAHTQGWGCSGGSYAQHQIGDNYPGLLEGIIPGCSFPEVGFATINFITDAWLLDDYFTARQAAMGWSDEQKRRVTGFHGVRHGAEHRGRRAPHRSAARDDELRSGAGRAALQPGDQPDRRALHGA